MLKILLLEIDPSVSLCRGNSKNGHNLYNRDLYRRGMMHIVLPAGPLATREADVLDRLVSK